MRAREQQRHGKQETARNGHGTARTGAAPAHTRDKEKGVSETGREGGTRKEKDGDEGRN